MRARELLFHTEIVITKEAVYMEDQIAVVTGGSRGIGRAILRELKDKGFRVHNLDLESVDNSIDVTQENQVKAAMDSIAATCGGRIDVLINNAGIFPHQPFDTLSLNDWRKVMSTNLDSMFICIQAALPYMKASGSGSIVNISSAVVFVGDEEMVHYAASKAGVIGLTRSLAKSLGKSGITINAITPGFIETPGVMASPEEVALFDVIVAEQSIQRRGIPSDIASCVWYLVSGASFVTGQVINVDGGHRFH